MSFLHGVETIVVSKGSRPITAVASSVIGLVGTAPKGAVNTLTVISNQNEATSTFGGEVPGFTIPQALSAIFAQGNTTVVVINVFDPATMVTAVTAEVLTITNGKARTAFCPIGTSFTLTNNAGTTTFVKGTDYTVDEFGDIVVLNFTSIAEGSSVKATYNKLNAAAVTSSVVVGTVNGTTDVKTGHKLYAECEAQFGYNPKLLICPTYCEIAGVASEMITWAGTLRGVCYIDAPEGETVAEVIAARGPSGTLAGFQSTSKRVVLCYPRVKVFDLYSNSNQLRPFSQFAAGVTAATDNTEETMYASSPSNHTIAGIEGLERMMTSALNDSTSQLNQLNAVGITTVFNSFGTGYRYWGNRTASFPSNTLADNFLPVQRTADVIHVSVEQAMLQFLDKPLNQATIDAIRSTVNAFLRGLVSTGKIIDGVCKYIPENNPPEDLAAGKVTFDIEFLPPTPAERITFRSFINIEFFRSLS